MNHTPSSNAQPPDVSRRVLVLAPVDGDARAVSQVLTEAGFTPQVCADIGAIAAEIARADDAGVGTVIVAQEALVPAVLHHPDGLVRALSSQPEWSDLPFILLASASSSEDVAWALARRLDPVGNITILERPLRRTTLLNAVSVALRARARQYERREILRELAHHRKHLEELVEQKTADLAASTSRLHAAERLASLGTLAAGLGHDIANLSLPIRARIDAMASTAQSDDCLADLDAIRVALTHLTRLSAGMRLMGMDPDRTDASAHATDLQAWAAETAPMLRAVLPRHITFECAVAPGLGVHVARHRLAQAVFNLVQNAGEAMASQRSGRVSVCVEPAPANVRFRVTDNGPGMPADVLARCFEPYFSTKGRSIATGMGLSMVKGIVECAGGAIQVDSAPGRGTTFNFTLPAIPPAPPPREPAALPTAAISVTSERIFALASMFIKRLDLNAIRHESPYAPSTQLWLLDRPDPARLSEYLRADPSRHALILSNTPPAIDPDHAQRASILPESPTPSALRDAILRARPSPASTHHA